MEKSYDYTAFVRKIPLYTKMTPNPQIKSLVPEKLKSEMNINPTKQAQ